jgi:MFS family permease
MVAGIMVASAIASQLITRIGARTLLVTGSVVATGGMFWLSRINEHSHYAIGLLGPMMLTAAGLGLIFVPGSLVALTKVADDDAGVASSLLNTGQQVGGALGLAVLGTVAWSAVAGSLRTHAAPSHALATGFSQGYLVSAGIMLLALVITVVAIRVRREDLAGVSPGWESPDASAVSA